MKRALHAVAWVLLVSAAFVLWPQRFGGEMTYVITTGTSMQPSFDAGDLAVLRAAPDYAVGDVVAYRSSELRRVVMHRITAEEDGAFSLQGDNNDFVDPETVRDDQVLGRLVVRVPQVGTALGWLVKPVNLVLLLAGLALLVGDRRRQDDPPAPAAPAPLPPLVVDVLELRVPESTLVAQLSDEAAVHALAARCGRPVLRDARTGELFLHDGATLYRYVSRAVEQARAEQRAREELRGSGRDWCYDGTAGLVPRPRRAPVDRPHGARARRVS